MIYEKLTQKEKDWASAAEKKIHVKLQAVRERSEKKIPSEAKDGVHDDKKAMEGPSGMTRTLIFFV